MSERLSPSAPEQVSATEWAQYIIDLLESTRHISSQRIHRGAPGRASKTLRPMGEEGPELRIESTVESFLSKSTPKHPIKVVLNFTEGWEPHPLRGCKLDANTVRGLSWESAESLTAQQITLSYSPESIHFEALIQAKNKSIRVSCTQKNTDNYTHLAGQKGFSLPADEATFQANIYAIFQAVTHNKVPINELHHAERPSSLAKEFTERALSLLNL